MRYLALGWSVMLQVFALVQYMYDADANRKIILLEMGSSMLIIGLFMYDELRAQFLAIDDQEEINEYLKVEF